MKILLLNDYKEEIGGAEIFLHNLKDELEEQGHEVRFFGGKRNNKNFGNISLSSFFKGFFNPISWKKIRKKIKNFEPDIIFVGKLHTNLSPLFLFSTKNFPVIIRIPALGAVTYPKQMSKRPYRIITYIKKYFIKTLENNYSDIVLAQSEMMKKTLKNIFDNKNIIKMYNPVFWEVLSEQHESSNQDFNVIYTGRLSYNKGLTYLIKSIKFVKEKHSNIKLYIFGKGELEKEIEEMIYDLNIENKVFLKGFVNHSKLKSFYNKSDLTVLPSIIKENCPSTVIESMSQGTPVITTNIGGQSELVKDGYDGFLVDPKKPNQLAHKIKMLIENKDILEEMSRNSLESARKFSKEKYIRDLEGLFEKLVEEYS